jgi:hypothetical protein
MLGPEALLAVEHAVVLETDPQSEAALWPDGEALPVLDTALDVFLTLPGHTSTKEDDERASVLSGIRQA